MGKTHFYSRDENGGLHDEGFIQAEGKVLNMYYFSFPVVTDWNEDGLFDIIVTGNGPSKNQCNLPIYLNEGTATDYSFGAPLVHKEEGGLGLPFMSPRIAPQVVDLDGDGRKDLVIGKNSYQPYAGMDFYRNIGTNASPELAEPVPILDRNGSGDWAPNAPGGKDQSECHPFFTDWNGDGALDIIIGGESGWNNIHISYGKPEDVAVEVQPKSELSYANAVTARNGMLNFENSSNEILKYTVYDLSGRVLIQESLDAGAVQSVSIMSAARIGVVSVESPTGIISNKTILLK